MNRLVAAAAVATTVSSSQACKPSPGYEVADGIPPPSRCGGAAATISGTATWIDTPKGRRIEILVTQPASPSFRLGDPSTITSNSRDVVDEATATSAGVRIVLAPRYLP